MQTIRMDEVQIGDLLVDATGLRLYCSNVERASEPEWSTGRVPVIITDVNGMKFHQDPTNTVNLVEREGH